MVASPDALLASLRVLAGYNALIDDDAGKLLTFTFAARVP